MTNSPTPSEQQVRDAIEIVGSSYSYDPPSRWLEAHQLLRALRLTLQDQVRPYRWIVTIGAVLGSASLIALVWLLMAFSEALASSNVLALIALWAAAPSVPSLIIAGSGRLSRALAARRFPLVKLKEAVDSAAARFEERYVSAYSGGST